MMSDRHFQGNGIRLRAPEPEDLEVMFRFENATDVWEMSNTTGPYSRFQLKQYIEQTQNDLFADRQLRLMIENGNRQVVGMVEVCSFAYIAVENLPSRRLFAACGYKESAVLKEWAHTFGGGYTDVLVVQKLNLS